jgi:tetratricopeptide (TPR) repeat protein
MPRATTIAFVGASIFLLGACGAGRYNRPQRTTVTSASLESGYREADVAAQEVTLGKYTEALARADKAVRLAPDNPWALYNRAVALHHLGRADSALEAYGAAEEQFGKDEWGRSLAIYGRARVLDDIGRCEDARKAYSEFASLVRPKDAAAAMMATEYAKQCRVPQAPPTADDAVLTDMTTALAVGDYPKVLTLRDKLSPAADANPWAHYNVGAALAGLHRTAEALAEYSKAEQAFGDRDRWGRSVAIWGRARALEEAGRCKEAQRVVEEYARTIGASDPSAIRVATAYTTRCE